MRLFNKYAILRDLDKHASEYNFPILDNAYVSYARARLSVFAGLDNWVIAFEVLGYSEHQGGFIDDLYAFGSCLSQEGVLSSISVLSEIPDSPLVDRPTQAWIADWSDWSISALGRRFDFKPTRDEYLKHGIMVAKESGPGSLQEKNILRYFIAKQGSQDLFMSKEQLLEELNGCPKMDIFLQTEEWHHPDVAGGELPSGSVSFTSLMDALERQSPSMFITGNVNTAWNRWDEATE